VRALPPLLAPAACHLLPSQYEQIREPTLPEPGDGRAKEACLLRDPTLSSIGRAPVALAELEQVEAVLHAGDLGLVHAGNVHAGLALPDLQRAVLRPQEVLRARAASAEQS